MLRTKHVLLSATLVVYHILLIKSNEHELENNKTEQFTICVWVRMMASILTVVISFSKPPQLFSFY